MIPHRDATRGTRKWAQGAMASLMAIAAAQSVQAQDASAAPAVPAQAPSAQPASATTQAPAAASAPQGSAAGDIVVTANKREQRLNDVGLSVAALSSDTLKTRQINSIQDLAAVVPGLSFTTSASGQPVYTLRGVGFYDTALAAYQTVAVYTDQAPLPFGAMTKHENFDLERVEVLKGPQGILFGENATAGSINYVSAKPTDHFEAGGAFTYGRFNQADGEGYVSGPLTSTLSARLSGRIEHADGWQYSDSRPGDSNGKTSDFMGRLLLDWKPTDRLRLQLNVNGWKDKSQPQAAQYIGLFPQNPVIDPRLLASPFSPRDPRAADWTPGNLYSNNNFYQAFLRGDYDVTDAVTLTTLTSYAHYKQHQGSDDDGLPLSVLDYPSDRGKIKSFFQEARLSNNPASRLRWVLGGNYERDSVYEIVDEVFTSGTVNSTLATLGYPIGQANFISDQRMRTWATFGNVEFDPISTITIKGGLRYTNFRNNGYACTRDLSGTDNQVGSFIYDVILGGAQGKYPAGSCFAVNGTANTLGGVPAGQAGAVVDTLKEHNLSWRAGVDWKPEHGLLFYAYAAKGYKAGGFPTIGATTVQQNLPYTQESVLAFEGGFKLSLFDRKLQLNGAGFYYKYNDEQLQSKADTPPFGIENVNLNIPKSKVAGFELEADWHPVRGLSINTAFTYLRAQVVKFTGLNATDIFQNYAGYPLPYTPKYQVGTNAEYDFGVSDSLNAFVGGGVNYRSKTVSIIGGELNPSNVTPTDLCFSCIKGYALVDARAGVEAKDGKWKAYIWGKNIFNKYYWNNVTALNDVYVRYAGLPATYGVTISFKFR